MLKGNDLHAWKSCSIVLPILEYCCLKLFCKPTQSTFISLSNSHHKLASPVKAKQNLCTLMWSWNLCVFIQSFVLSKPASASSSGLPEYLGLMWDQFNADMCGEGRCSTSSAWGAFDTIGSCGFWVGWGLCWAGGVEDSVELDNLELLGILVPEDLLSLPLSFLLLVCFHLFINYSLNIFLCIIPFSWLW